jgi:hypothetical protein
MQKIDGAESQMRNTQYRTTDSGILPDGGTMKGFASLLVPLALIGGLFVLGVFVHEAGHAAAALAFGGRLTGINVLGMRLLPTFGWDFQAGYYGFMSYKGDLTPAQMEIVSLCGSMATFALALAAQAVWWTGPLRRGWPRWAVLTVCFFWLDVLTHTLPTLGIPAYLFFGKHEISRAAEAYLAAVALGMPGWLFQALAVGFSAALGAITVVRWLMLERSPSHPPDTSPHSA